jgi:GNAT superfamily N-acetyltransferase
MTEPPAASIVEIEEVAPTSPDAEYCLSRYYEDISERFEGGFDPALSVTPSLDEFAPPWGTFVVVRLNGKLVGCGGFKSMPPDAAYLKRMWVAGEARGHGLGKRLLNALEDRARELGYRKVRLETHKSLGEAQQLYRSHSYVEVPPFGEATYAHHWFEKRLS